MPGRSARPHMSITKKGELTHFEAPSTAAGLAFCRKASVSRSRITTARRFGFRMPGAQPERLEWKGSHLGVTISPDGKFLMTSMQEPMLHGWRLADGKHMRMSGYSARVRSLELDRRTANFSQRRAPSSSFCGRSTARMVRWDGSRKFWRAPRPVYRSFACHPRQPAVAAGYADGAVRLVRIEDDALFWRGSRRAFGECAAGMERARRLPSAPNPGTRASSPCDRLIAPHYDGLLASWSRH